MLRGPFQPAAVHQRDVRVAEVIEDPPEPRGIDAAALVVDDHPRRVGNTQLAPSSARTPRASAERSAARWRRGSRPATDTRAPGTWPPSNPDCRMSTTRTFASAACAATQSVSTSCSGCAYDIAAKAKHHNHGEKCSVCRRLEQCSASLDGVSVLVAGAGLAGLAAARELVRRRREASPSSTPAIASAGASGPFTTGSPTASTPRRGGDLIEGDHQAVRSLAEQARSAADQNSAKRLGLRAARSAQAGLSIVRPTATSGWSRLGRARSGRKSSRTALAERPVGHADCRRSGAPIGVVVARRDPRRRGRCARPRIGLRGFFLADPEELSLIALVDQFAADTDGPGRRCIASRAATNGSPPRSPHRSAIGCGLNCEVVAISQRGRTVRVSVKARRAAHADRVRLRDRHAAGRCCCGAFRCTPALPAQQHDAIARLKLRPRDARRCCSSTGGSGAASAGRARSDPPLPIGARLGRQRRAARPRRDPVAARRRRRQRRDAGDQREEWSARARRLAGVAGRATRRAGRVATDRLGAGSVRARRLRVLRSVIRSGLTRVAARARAGGSSSPASTPACGGRGT